MSLARKVQDPQVSGDVASRGRPRASNRSLRGDLAELQRLMRVLERHAPVDPAHSRRDLTLLGARPPTDHAESHLRAIAALLVTLATYQDVTAGRRVERRPAAQPRPRHVPAPPVNGRPVNGRVLNGRPGSHPSGSTGPDEVELAAAAARYIARDLAARQLSEFTSAEGYRLARALARLGKVEAGVERLLAEANQVRLHPMPLVDALSHSPH